MHCKTFNHKWGAPITSEDLFQNTFTVLLQVTTVPYIFFFEYQPTPGRQIDWGLNNFKFEKLNSSYTRTYNCSKNSMGLYLQLLGRMHLSQEWLKSLPRLIITVSLKSNCNTCNGLWNQYIIVFQKFAMLILLMFAWNFRVISIVPLQFCPQRTKPVKKKVSDKSLTFTRKIVTLWSTH